jgi:hypothetical protein
VYWNNKNVFKKGLLLAKFEVLTAMFMIQISGILRCVTGRLWHTFRWRVVTSYLGQILDPLSMKIDAKKALQMVNNYLQVCTA